MKTGHAVIIKLQIRANQASRPRIRKEVYGEQHYPHDSGKVFFCDQGW